MNSPNHDLHATAPDYSKLVPGTRQILVGFDLPPSADTKKLSTDHTRTWVTHPCLDFLPLGLFFWGAGEDTYIERTQIGNQSNVEVAGNAIRASYFETGLSFEELKRLAAERGLPILGAAARAIIEMSECHMGNTLSLTTRGPFSSFCMWGVTYDGPRARSVRIHAHEAGGFKGEVLDRTLVGDRLRFEASTVTEDACVKLLAPFLGSGRHA